MMGLLYMKHFLYSKENSRLFHGVDCERQRGDMDGGDGAALPDDGEWRGLELDDDAQDEAAALSEALALVDQCGLVSLEDLGIVDDREPTSINTIPSHDGYTGSSSALPPSPGLAATTTKRTSSRRQKEELQYLRMTVATLEKELAVLKTPADRSTSVATPLVSVWEDIATRQSQERHKAEVENVKLRLLLEEQLRVAKIFERLLKKRRLADFFGQSPPRINSRARLTAVAVDELWDHLKVMHAEVDSILSSDRFKSNMLPVRDIQVRVDEGSAIAVEAVEKRITPFHLQELANAMWHQMAHHTHADDQTHHGHHVRESDNRFTRDFIVQPNSTRGKASFTGTIVAQQFVELDRVVFVWISTMKPTESTDNAEGGMQQTAYVVLTSEQGENHKPVTLVRVLLAFQLDRGNDTTQSQAVGDLTNFVLNSVSLHLEEARQSVENALLLKSGIREAQSRTV